MHCSRIYQICEDHTCSREYTPELDDQPKKRGPKPRAFKRASTPVAKVENDEEERDQLDELAGVTPVAMPAKLQQVVRQHIEQADLKASIIASSSVARAYMVFCSPLLLASEDGSKPLHRHRQSRALSASYRQPPLPLLSSPMAVCLLGASTWALHQLLRP